MQYLGYAYQVTNHEWKYLFMELKICEIESPKDEDNHVKNTILHIKSQFHEQHKKFERALSLTH